MANKAPARSIALKREATSRTALGDRTEAKNDVLSGKAVCAECKQPIIPGTPWVMKDGEPTHVEHVELSTGKRPVLVGTDVVEEK